VSQVFPAESGAFGGLQTFKIQGLRRAGAFSFRQGIAQGHDLAFVFFQEPKPRAQDIAGRAIAARLHLAVDEVHKVISKRDRCVSGHGAPPWCKIYQGLVSDKRAVKKKAYVMLEDGQTIDVTTGL
jgi:hypothetical protein